jgi:hypothetical protein
VARTFVDDAARDGNLPTSILEQLDPVPDDRAVVILRALATAAARLPRADQNAMLLAESTLRLVERGVTDSAPAALERVEVLINRPADSEFRPEIAAAAAARAWGRLGDAEAVMRLRDNPTMGPNLARGLAEGGHGALADETLGRVVTLSKVDPIAVGEIAVTELIRGRTEQARKLVAVSAADWRAVYALILATAAVERKHPDARAILADAAAIIDREARVGPNMMGSLSELHHELGDIDGAAKRRARMRADLEHNPDARAVQSGLYELYGLALDAGSADEAAAVFAAMEARGAAPWMLSLARGERLVKAGELQAAVDDVSKLAADAYPPRGVVHLEVLLAYLARSQRDPALEQWLVAHVCE